MSMYRWLWVGVLMIIVGSVSLFVYQGTRPATVPLPEVSKVDVDTATRHRSYSRDAALYAVVSTSTYAQRYSERIAGGIVSHHLLANLDIARFFAEFTDQAVCRVVLVGPNHYFPHGPRVVSTVRDYDTPFGVVQTDQAFVEALVSSQLAVVDAKTIEEEHSISSLVPYVAAYFPGATVVPLIMNRAYDEMALETLAAAISRQSDDCTIVVASVDFSHHLYSNMSALHDRRSVVALSQFDYASLQKLEVDSPSSLAVALRVFAGVGARALAIQQQSAAAIFGQYDSDDVTSYVFAHALPGEPKPASGASLLLFGDLMLGRGVADRPQLWSGIRGPEGNFMKGYDAVIGNIEGAVARPGCTVADDDLLITGDVLRQLRREGVTHGGVMNNHFMRCPSDTEWDTIFDESGLIPIATKPVVVSGTGRDIHIVNIYAAPVPADTAALVANVAAIPRAATTVVYIHWGVEYADTPSDPERALAHSLIEAGADAIVGHHPHVVQPVELYRGVPIFYSLGNLFSDQVGEATRQGYALGLWSGTDGNSFYMYPYEQRAGGIPTHLTQAAARDFCRDIYEGDQSAVADEHPCMLHSASAP